MPRSACADGVPPNPLVRCPPWQTSTRGAFDRLADDYERLDAEARQAAADAENAESGHKREAQAAAKAAAEAAANVVVESAADTETKES
jgi:hypothetical protein